MRLNKIYLLLAILLLLTEAYIAAYVHDAFIRPFFGDLLVVILLYCAVRSIFNMPVIKTTAIVLAIAYGIEFSQHFHLARVLGIEHSKIAARLIGSYFSFIDLLMYTAGAIVIIVAEHTALKIKTHGEAIE